MCKFSFAYSAGTMEIYELLVDTEKYSNRLWFETKEIDSPKVVCYSKWLYKESLGVGCPQHD